MNHLTEDELVLHLYHDDASPAEVEQHLASCADCRREYDSLRRVLALVDEMPVPERSDAYGTQVWNRLRWRLGRERRWDWRSAMAIAAVLAIAFVAGALWHAQHARVAAPPATAVAATAEKAKKHERPRDRVLFVVVSDHLDSSERMLVDLSNANPKQALNFGEERTRAADLLISNELYRETAARRGDKRLAAVLSELEPLLIEIANSDARLSPREVDALQKRIESQGLLFKVRVASAQTKEMSSL